MPAHTGLGSTDAGYAPETRVADVCDDAQQRNIAVPYCAGAGSQDSCNVSVTRDSMDACDVPGTCGADAGAVVQQGVVATDDGSKFKHGQAHQRLVNPSHWCVTREQFREFPREVEQRYPDTDPNAYEVNETIIKPKTQDSGLSYTLQQNNVGVKIKYFANHAWAESVKQFGAAVLKALDLKGEGNLGAPRK